MQVAVDYAVHPAGTTDTTHEPPGQNVMASGEVDMVPDMGPDRVAWDAASAIQQAVMKEEGAVAVTQELIREKRIETQTAALSEEILRQMEQKSGYEKGTQAYTDAQNLIREKIREMLENKNKPLV